MPKTTTRDVRAPAGKRYQLIYADPPWQYNSRNRRGGIGTTVHNTYDTMDRQALIDMKVAERYADEDCVLLMWATGPKMHDALAVLEGWGFRYINNFLTWVKVDRRGRPVHGVGHYTRSNAEFLLLGARGRVSKYRATSTQPFASSVLFARRREHSRKPTSARKRVFQVFDEALVPDKLELFAREATPGWDIVGNQVGLFEQSASAAAAAAAPTVPEPDDARHAMTQGERDIGSYFKTSRSRFKPL